MFDKANKYINNIKENYCFNVIYPQNISHEKFRSVNYLKNASMIKANNQIIKLQSFIAFYNKYKDLDINYDYKTINYIILEKCEHVHIFRSGDYEQRQFEKGISKKLILDLFSEDLGFNGFDDEENLKNNINIIKNLDNVLISYEYYKTM